MELKRLISQFAYRIEPKPDGGFIARATDPSVPPLEAPSRQELLKKIQEKTLAGLSAEFPALKLPDGAQQQFAFHVERTPAGGFSIHPADPNAEVIHASTDSDLQSQMLEKFLNALGKRLIPELVQAAAAQGTANVTVSVNRKTAISFNTASPQLGPGPVTNIASTPSAPPESAKLDGASFRTPDPSPAILNNSPITPEPSNLGKIFRWIPVFLLLATLIYFFLGRR